MDTADTAKVDVSNQVEDIKANMPAVYAAIKAKAAQVGNVAYELVRRGLRGEAGCFWALEGGWVVGTPFCDHPVMRHVDKALVEYGCAYVCIWPDGDVITGLNRKRAAQDGKA